ncbi:MAG: phenylalanine--tRNA ligase subunit beta [Candidatus Omnitrophota bacterium]
MESVEVKPSDIQTQKCLELAGTRPISNVVDVTNYVLFECGQPLHAFDFDKIIGQKIIVRRAREGEPFLGIDGIEYKLDRQTLVIADAERAIAIAGVMGGRLTEVGASTRRVLLESAYFDPALVRQASKKYKIVTESSYRFERSVDPCAVARASARAAELIARAAGGRPVGGLVERNYLPRTKPARIELAAGRVEALLGQKIGLPRMARILKSLEFDVRAGKKGTLNVRTSTRRRDVTQEADLVEEILRIEGFDKIPCELPVTRFNPESAPVTSTIKQSHELKKYLAAAGLTEIVTYNLLSEKVLKSSGIDSAACHQVRNAASAEQGYFRPSLLPGMLGAAMFNLHRKAAQIKFFEIGNCYAESTERSCLALGLCGMSQEDWRTKIPASFYELKGLIENLLGFLGIKEFAWQHRGQFAWSGAASTLVLAGGRAVGRLGSVAPEVMAAWDLSQELFYAELELEPLLSASCRQLCLEPVSRYPSVRRDIALVADERVDVADLAELIRRYALPYACRVNLFDQYKGKSIPAGKRSLAFSLALEKDTGTFTDEEIQKVEAGIREALKNRYPIEYR